MSSSILPARDFYLGLKRPLFLRSDHIAACKEIFSPVQEIVMQKSFDQRFYDRVCNKSNPSSARVKASPARIEVQTKICAVAATNHAVKVIGRAGFIHCFD